MKFKLSTSGHFYDRAKYREQLKKLGFTFQESDYREYAITDHEPEIEFNTLDDLIKFSKKFGELIITPTTIEIYDNYRE